jgi:hypothetical protein
MKKALQYIYNLLNSRHFFYAILIFFSVESSWFVLFAAYPQAFDENFHFGLIKIYSHYWLPFLSHQPADGNAYGAVARDPSYLYHYLMSFPYRLIALFIHSEIGQVIALRIINIGLFATGLILSRRVLIRVGISRPLADCSILIFTLIPIVPQLAAQVNYDNLLIPLVAWVILLAFKITDQIRSHKPSPLAILNLMSICFLTSLVKYAFLPIFFGIAVFLGIITIKANAKQWRALKPNLREAWAKNTRSRQILVALLFFIAVGMFLQRDGINLVRYHSIEPECGVVLNVHDCSAYSPWYYNYTNHNQIVGHKASIRFANPASYTLQWLYWMWYRSFFAVNGPTDSFTNYPPLPLPSAAAILVAVVGGIAVVKWRRRIFNGNVYLILLFIVCGFYVVTLMLQGYATYRYTDVLENMNGRYLLPILLFVAAIVGRGISIALRNAARTKIIFVIAVLLLFLQGGGTLTFIARSDNDWDVNNPTVVKVNNAARKITNPVLVNGRETYTTNYWLFN